MVLFFFFSYRRSHDVVAAIATAEEKKSAQFLGDYSKLRSWPIRGSEKARYSGSATRRERRTGEAISLRYKFSAPFVTQRRASSATKSRLTPASRGKFCRSQIGEIEREKRKKKAASRSYRVTSPLCASVTAALAYLPPSLSPSPLLVNSIW